MKARAAPLRLGASLSAAVVLAFGLSACGSSKSVHEDTSATQTSTQAQALPPGTENHFLEACDVLKHENSSADYSKEECSTIYAFTERHTSRERMNDEIRSTANKALTEQRFTGTEAEIQKQSIEYGFEIFVAQSLKTYEEAHSCAELHIESGSISCTEAFAIAEAAITETRNRGEHFNASSATLPTATIKGIRCEVRPDVVECKSSGTTFSTSFGSGEE